VAALIQRLFGVTFCPFHVGRILAATGWEPQKPQRSARRATGARHAV
jgi:transposase